MKIILFDGECNFCNQIVIWILKNDTKKVFNFASLQSKYGQKFLIERSLDSKNFDTIILFEPKKAYYIKSSATLNIISEINIIYWIIAKILLLIPRFIRDFVYSIISKNRHHIIKNNSCLVPDESIRKRFID